jgi:hypothetical protein
MNLYKVQHRLKTLSALEQPFDCRSFNFRSWETKEWFKSDFWIAEREIEAENYLEAMKIFQKELPPIVKRLAFVSQCYFDHLVEPFLIYTENPGRIIFVRNSEQVNGARLVFGVNEKKSLEKLDEFAPLSFYEYLQESTNAISHLGRLSMLIKALEGLAGQTKKIEKCECGKERGYSVINSDMLGQILNDKALYNKLFGKGGVRHKLSHGSDIELDDDYARKIYDAIVNYFNKKFGTEINTNIRFPQRNFYGNYRISEGFFRLKSGAVEIDLRKITELINFHFCKNPILPNEYLETIEKPKKY